MDGQLLGAILAGGRATRMGRDKALVAIGGVPMVERVASAMRGVAGQVVVVGRAQPLAGLPAIPDTMPGPRGPLAGLAAALAVAAGRFVVLVAVDQPLVAAATLAHLAGRAEPDQAVVPIAGGARQVTCAVYPPAWAGEAAAELASGGSIQSLLDRLPYVAVEEAAWRAWGEDGRSWMSVDTLDDVARAEAVLAGH